MTPGDLKNARTKKEQLIAKHFGDIDEETKGGNRDGVASITLSAEDKVYLS